MESDWVGNFIVIMIGLVVAYFFLLSKDGKKFFEQEVRKLQQESTEALEKERGVLARTKWQSVTFGVIAVVTIIAGNMFAFIKWLVPGYEFLEGYLTFRADQDGALFTHQWSIPAFIAVFSLYAFFRTSTKIKDIENVLEMRRHRDQVNGPE